MESYGILEDGSLSLINHGFINGMRGCYLSTDYEDHVAAAGIVFLASAKRRHGGHASSPLTIIATTVIFTHEKTKKQLIVLLKMLAREGEETTFSYIRHVILKK